mmetsp:Transcript_18737/g.51289  ORF Transcript_18737/g.51289 Transcript_18737/m.51289 type:complete len:108 (-) Transcript_18737:475-798(-)
MCRRRGWKRLKSQRQQLDSQLLHQLHCRCLVQARVAALPYWNIECNAKWKLTLPVFDGSLRKAILAALLHSVAESTTKGQLSLPRQFRKSFVAYSSSCSGPTVFAVE